MEKDCDVPQGFVASPNLYKDSDAAPPGYILQRLCMLFHIYGGNTLMYLPFLLGDEKSAVTKLELCLKETSIGWPQTG